MDKNDRMPPAETGNASNPSHDDKTLEPVQNNQLLDEKAETYLRESGTIEDMPDANDEAEMDRISESEN